MKVKINKNLSFSDKIILTVTFFLLSSFAIFLLIGSFLFGFAGFFHLTGVHYESKNTLLQFVILLISLSLLNEFIAKLLIRFLRTRISQGEFLHFCKMVIIYLSIWLPIHLADEYIVGINIPIWLELIVVQILYVANFVFE